jgi:hypothetical protein
MVEFVFSVIVDGIFEFFVKGLRRLFRRTPLDAARSDR